MAEKRAAETGTVKFNVGGKLFEVLRVPTLSSHPECLLSVLLEEHESQASHSEKRRKLGRKNQGTGQRQGSRETRSQAGDEAGPADKDTSQADSNNSEERSSESAIFVNANPELFPYILDYLRYRKILIPQTVSKASMAREAAFFCLSEVTEATIEQEVLQLSQMDSQRQTILDEASTKHKAYMSEASARLFAGAFFQCFLNKLDGGQMSVRPLTVSAKEMKGCLGIQGWSSNIAPCTDRLMEIICELCFDLGLKANYVEGSGFQEVCFFKEDADPATAHVDAS